MSDSTVAANTSSAPSSDALNTLRFYVTRAATEIAQLAPRRDTALRTACTQLIGEHAHTLIHMERTPFSLATTHAPQRH